MAIGEPSATGQGAAAAAYALNTIMQCRHCVWQILEPDLFCSWCGQDIFQITTVQKEPIRLYVGTDPKLDEAGQVRVTLLRNDSPSKIALACADAPPGPPWLKVNLLKSVVEPDKSLEATFTVDRRQLTNAITKGHFTVQPSSAGAPGAREFQRASFEVQVWPLPDFTIQSGTAFVAEHAAFLNLLGSTDADLWVTAAVFDPPIISFAAEFPYEIELGEFEVPVRLDTSQRISFQAQKFSYQIYVAGLMDPLTGHFDLDIRKAATLRISKLDQAVSGETIGSGTEDKVAFYIANTGEDDLKINGIEVEPLGPLIQVQVGAYPAILGPGEEAKITISVAVDALAQSREHWFTVDIDCNDPDVSHCAKDFQIIVVNEIHAGFIALDFGTTDSTAAFFNVNEIPANLNLESEKEPKIYSNILFTNYLEDRDIPFTWLIGNQAKKLGPTLRDRFVKAIKTRAGTGYKARIVWEEGKKSFPLEADEIIKFIMMDLIRFAHGCLGKKPVKFILSVPTRFTLRQKAVLKEALENAAAARRTPVDRVEVIDESLAAGLYYILERGPNDERVRNKKNYTLMILDFGGGTTDVTVFRIYQQLRSDQSLAIEKVEIIGAWGDATLGGEAITLDIATIMAEKFLHHEVDPEDDIREVRKLEDEAEALKIAVSELQSFQDRGKLDIEAAVTQGSDALKENLEYLTLKPQDDEGLRSYLKDFVDHQQEFLVWSSDFERQSIRIKAQEVIDIFSRRLTAFKQELEPFLQTILTSHPDDKDQETGDTLPSDFRVDMLLLAGQSAQFPVVTEIFQDVARNQIDFIRDSSGKPLLKECVSRGSLYYISYLNGGESFEITGNNRQWTRLGRVVGKTGSYPPFEEIIPWGKEYPTEQTFTVLGLTAITGRDRLRLEIKENLKFHDDERRQLNPYKTFEIILKDPSPVRFNCKLEIDSKGEAKAFCEIDGDWKEMQALT